MWNATIRPSPLHFAAISEDARVAGLVRKPCFAMFRRECFVAWPSVVAQRIARPRCRGVWPLPLSISPRTTPHCAVACLALVFLLAAMRPALLHRAAMSRDDCAARPICKLFSRFSAGSASLPGRPRSPNILLAPRAALRGGAVRDVATSRAALRVCRAPCHTARCASVWLRSFVSRHYSPHLCAAPPCPKMLAPCAKFAKWFLRLLAGKASRPGRPPSPSVFLARRPRRRGLLPCATLPIECRLWSRRAIVFRPTMRPA